MRTLFLSPFPLPYYSQQYPTRTQTTYAFRKTRKYVNRVHIGKKPQLM